MAKKLAEEAIEVVIDAMNGDREAVVRESADLLYNLVVLWAEAGVRPQDVFAEMARRERLSLAEKLPKKHVETSARRKWSCSKPAAKNRRALSALQLRWWTGRAGQSSRRTVSNRDMLRRLYDWCIAAAGAPMPTWLMGAISFLESSVFPIPPDTMLIPMSLPRRPRLVLRPCLYPDVRRRRVLGYAIGACFFDLVGHWLIQSMAMATRSSLPGAYGSGAWIIVSRG